MEKLSENNRGLQLTVPVILFITSLLLCVFFLKNYAIYMTILLVILITFFSLYILKIYKQTENIFYDTNYLYLIGNQGERKIKLNRIKRVKLTLSEQKIFGFQYYLYRIDFKIGEYSLDSVEFWISNSNKKLGEFEKMISYYYPNINIEHHASTFNN
ncbi:hypothetical protein FIA58_014230 [Flavobacterium jejuense]|uniref:DUF304 domain-containing protein n=1 Tax=Flavobacterium jejuense TaxID=1544455 RepID=A0ABX0IVL4_9FLAO|nr:hypothetical protein [Flavobacterium jejuense]NHN26839.1 hypothetical protein [Flavobacterium jejuense]